MSPLTLPAQLPTTDEEIWRYSRIDELDLGRYTPGSITTAVTDPDGFAVDPDAEGVDLDVIGTEAPDVFAALNLEHAAPVVIRVPRGKAASAPVVITHTVSNSGVVAFPRLVIDAAEDSEVTVIEVFETPDGSGDTDALVIPVVQVRCAQNARVNYLAIDELGQKVWKIGHQQADVGRDASLLFGTVALGGDYARVRTEARATGSGANTRQVALYFAADDQMHDFRTIQDHDAPYTQSDLLFKGAVQDRARSVYTGLIRIREHARGTAAYQTNRNLTLSDGAWAESVPNLEIENNDVKCSHASTVGPIDEDQRFYLESRGMHPDVAERLVVLGFFDEILGQLPIGDLAADIRRRVAAKLTIGVSADGQIPGGAQ